MKRLFYHLLLLMIGMAIVTPANARELRPGGKLLLTGGVSTVEGSAGGGLATWSLIAGNETDAGIGGTAHATIVALPDFDLKSIGGAIGIRNRVELSYAHQVFDTRGAGAALGLGRNFKFAQDVFGAKVRLIGDAVYDQDTLMPQISVGVQYRRAAKAEVIAAVGGKHAQGTDFYLSATKVVLSKSLVLGATVRFTKANQFGLLGFGGDRSDTYHPQFEGSAGVLVSRRLLVGAEIRTKPNNLGFAREQKAYDAFAAWQFQRHFSVTAAYTDLGDIATVKRQRGAFLSLQASF
ncbi:DUF3034 family protein [Sphingomonas sp. MMS24-J45]|uniref:DUF3034 family protein n=1 Tax=Sphingomonas sp. MMS24-J45 TaxID=3238806 RepID=UPI00384B8CAF